MAFEAPPGLPLPVAQPLHAHTVLLEKCQPTFSSSEMPRSVLLQSHLPSCSLSLESSHPNSLLILEASASKKTSLTLCH